MKINHRINLTHMIMLVILTVLLAGAINLTMTGVFEKEIKDGEFAVAVHVARGLTNPLLNDDFAQVQQFIDHEKTQPPLDIKYVYVIDRDGAVVAHTFQQVFPVELATANPVPPGENSSIRIVSIEGESVTDIGVLIPAVEDTSVHIGFSREPFLNVVNMLNSEILGIIAFILLLSLVVSFFVIRTITRPIERLVEGTEIIGKGKIDYRVDVEGPDEVQTLAKSFNQMAEDLKISEAKYCSVADSVNDIIYLVDSDLCFLACNRKSLECMKVLTGDILGKPLIEVIRDPDEKEFYQKKLQRILETGKSETHEREFIISGEKRYYSMTMVPVFDSEGNVTAVACVGCDITERKRAEEALQESEEKYRNVVDVASDAIIVHREGRIIFANPAAVTLVGAKGPEDLIGKSVLDFIPQENRELVIERMQHILATHEPAGLIEEKLIRMDGSVIDAEVTGTFITYGGEPAVQTMVHDITRRKRAEEALHESEERYRSVVDLASDAIIVHREGRLVYANHATAVLMGAKAPEDLIGKSVLDFIPPENRELITERIHHILDTHEPVVHLEQQLVRMDGSVIDAEVTGTFITYRGEPAIMTMVHDITERKRAEEELLIKHKQLLSIFDSIDEIVYVADPDTYELLYFNEAFRSRFGGQVGDKCYRILQKEPSPCSFCSNKYIFGENLGKTYIWEWQNLVDRHWYRCIDRAIKWPDGRMVRYEMAIDITELKQAEEEVHAAQQKLIGIIEFLPDATLVIDAEKKVIAWNRAIEEMTGIKKEDVLGKGDYAYAVPFYGERRPILIDLVLDFDSDIEKKYDFVEKIGNTLLVETFVPAVYEGKGAYLWAVASPLFDSSGKLIGAIESIRDITERKRMDAALQEQKDFASDLIQYSATPTFVIDAQHKVLFWNAACEDLTGVKASELVGTDGHWKSVYDHKRPTLADMIISGDFENSLKYYSILGPSRHISNGLHAENWFPNVGGMERYLIFDSAPIYNREGKLIAAVETIQDITEHKKTEDALRDSRYMLQTVLDSIPSAVFWKNRDLIYLGGNRTWLESAGMKSLEEVIGKSDRDLPWEKEQTDSFRKVDRRVIESGIPEYDIIEAYLLADGTKAWARTNKVPLRDTGGNIVGVLGTYEDITVRKKAEEDLEKYSDELKRSNELKDLFTDILRHDLLNPASIIKGYTEILLEMEEEEKKLKSIKAIERNNQKLIDMIETASRFAMLESVEELEFNEMDIGVIFKEVVENFRSTFEEKKMVIEFAGDGSYPSKVSPVIEEVFANLLSNAIKYSPEKSRIIIDIMDAGENWKVSVTDFGTGISDEDKPKIFDRFKRVEKGAVKGTGLGLAIVKRLISLHGGTVGIEDNLAGQGSVFWVTLKKA